MVQPIFTSLPPTTTHHHHPPPPTKNICFKRLKRRGRYKIPKSVPRGDGSRGSDKEEEWLLVAEEEVVWCVRCGDRRRD